MHYCIQQIATCAVILPVNQVYKPTQLPSRDQLEDKLKLVAVGYSSNYFGLCG